MTNEEATNYLIRHCNPDYPKGKLEWETAINTAIDALKKQIPQKPIGKNEMWQCPSCKRNLTYKNCVKKMYSFCPKCGQAIYWG